MWYRCNLAAKENGLECTCMNNDNFTVQVSGAVDAIEWACVLWGRHLLNGLASRAANLNQILLKLEHSSVETIEMIHKATAVAAGDWQLHHDNIHDHTSCLMQEFFKETWTHPGDSVPPQWGFGALKLLAFLKTKITFEREEISDCQWDLGK